MNEPLHIGSDVHQAAEQLLEVIPHQAGTRTVIAVGGESGSGKSTTAIALRTTFLNRGISSVVLHLDGYFKLPPRENHLERTKSKDWIGLSEVRLDLLQAHLDAFKSGAQSLSVPVVDYLANRIDDREVPLNGVEVLIIEGTYALYLEHFEVGILMPRDYTQTQRVRQARTRETYSPFVEEVLAIEHQLVRSSHSRAHWMVDDKYVVHANQGNHK